ncbi:MAG: cupredoxin domain-containing protein [Acidimicrobiales bacterium]
MTREQSWRSVLLGVVGAGLLFASAGIHLDLYLTGYQRIPAIGVLFLLQAATAIALGLAVLVAGRLRARVGTMPAVLAWSAAALFALGTIAGYGLSRAVGLFGFQEQPTTAGLVAGIVELGAFVALGSLVVTGLAGLRSSGPQRTAAPGAPTAAGSLPGGGDRPGSGFPRRVPPVVLAVLSAALLAVVLSSGIGSSIAPATAGSTANGSATQGSATQGSAAQGSAAQGSAANGSAPKGTTPMPVVQVVISNYTYHPDRVMARPGETIAVTNHDKVTHTLTAVPGSTPFGNFDTSNVDPGHTVRIQAPKTPGTYDFYCSFHHFMRGELVVSG